MSKKLLKEFEMQSLQFLAVLEAEAYDDFTMLRDNMQAGLGFYFIQTLGKSIRSKNLKNVSKSHFGAEPHRELRQTDLARSPGRESVPERDGSPMRWPCSEITS